MEGPGDAKPSRQQRSGGDASPTQQRLRVKQEMCEFILKQLAEDGNDVVDKPGFAEELLAHFTRLPTRYALDVNVERADDVLTHKRLLRLAQIPDNRPAFHVRPVHVFPVKFDVEEESPVGTPVKEDIPGPLVRSSSRLQVYPPPAFGSTPNLEALASLDIQIPEEVGGGDHSPQSPHPPHMPMHEVTFSTIDKPKLLSQLSALLADVGLNIREAHVFSTVDGYSLDVFVVDGWPTEDTHDLEHSLRTALNRMEKSVWLKSTPASSLAELPVTTQTPVAKAEQKESTDDWEIDSSQLSLNQKIAAGSFGDLYRGTYCGQDVAIKILKAERLNDNLQREFKQEISIMRKVRHKNLVQFIGACTKPPNLSIVTEYMAGGSVYDYLHKQRGAMKLSMVIRVAIDVSKGMDYLHQNNIIHRDLKTANLLMDENEVVKVADFGVARVQASSGIMTAETGTYRWMAPEVIEHKAYDRRVDVFSFGIVLWELLTGKLPYADLTPLQAAVGVVQKGLRPTIPKGTHTKLADLLERSWKTDPTERPDFSEITTILLDLAKELGDEVPKDKKGGGFLSALKRSAGSR